MGTVLRLVTERCFKSFEPPCLLTKCVSKSAVSTPCPLPSTTPPCVSIHVTSPVDNMPWKERRNEGRSVASKPATPIHPMLSTCTPSTLPPTFAGNVVSTNTITMVCGLLGWGRLTYHSSGGDSTYLKVRVDWVQFHNVVYDVGYLISWAMSLKITIQ